MKNRKKNVVYYPGVSQSESEKVNRIINIPQIITILVSLIPIGFTIFSYVDSQANADRRKYSHLYLDERYKVLKDITGSIAEINNIIIYDKDNKYDSADERAIRQKASVFSYSYLVLDEHNRKDSMLLKYIKDYSYTMNDLLNGEEGISPSYLQVLGQNIISQCGKILIHEKDSINSYDFRLFDF